MEWRDRWLAFKASTVETAFVLLPVLFPGPGTQARGSSHAEGPSVPESPVKSRAFWLYCAFLSLLFFAIGLGILHGGAPHPQSAGIVFIVIGVSVTLLCLFNAARGKP